jgi:hypothetical protein
MRVIFAVAALIVLASAVQEDINDEDFSEASQAVDVMLQEGKSDSACRKLANGSKQEISNGQKNTQRLLNRMDVGKNCHTAGLSAYNAAKRRESNAKKAADTATRNCNKAKNARVKVGSKSLSQFKVGCSAFLNDPAYTRAKGHMTRTCNDATRKRAAHADSRRATASALRAHQKAKEQCACRAQKTHKAAVRTTTNFNSAANAKAWTKAHHMLCVLDGKAANRCSVPRVPRVTAPRMPSWVARVNTCESHRRERAAKQKERNTKATERKNKAAHRERTSKATERKNKHHHRERTDKTNKERNSKHHSRERTSKANERKGKAANTCKHGVIIYQHYHFRGYGRRFYRGRYDMNAMIRKGVKNDDASSAKVYNGCKLIIYQHSRFNGHHATFNCNHGGWCNFDWNHFTRRGVGNDHMSSLRVCNRNGSGC